jgi:hypothetical protein
MATIGNLARTARVGARFSSSTFAVLFGFALASALATTGCESDDSTALPPAADASADHTTANDAKAADQSSPDGGSPSSEAAAGAVGDSGAADDSASAGDSSAAHDGPTE